MFRTAVAAFAAVALCLIAACNPATAFRDDASEALTKSTFDLIRQGDPNVARNLTPEMAANLTPDLLAQMKAEVPPEAPRRRTGIAATLRAAPDGQSLDVMDQYDFANDAVLVETVLSRPAKDRPWRVNGFHIKRVTAAAIAQNRFTAPGKSPLQYLFLLLTIAAPIGMIWALVKVIRTRGLRRKWLWGILAFVGLFQFQLNWTTGQFGWTPLTIQFIGFGIVKGFSPLAPWVISVTLPVCAILILTGVWANPARAKSPPPPPQPEQAFE